MQSTYDVLSGVLRQSSSMLRRLIAEFQYKRFDTSPNNLEFIEITAGFHKGYLPGMARPRSQQKYDQCLSEYTELLRALCAMAPSIHVVNGPSGRRVAASDHRVLALYKRFNVDASMPFDDLFARAASCLRTIREQPKPMFQSKYIDDLPLEILIMVVSYMDDACMITMSHTCRGWRGLCAPHVGKKAFFRMRYDMRILHRSAPTTRDELHNEIVDAMDKGRAKALASMSAYKEASVGRLPLEFVSFENEWDALWPDYLCRFAVLPQTDDLVFEVFYNGIISLLACRQSVSHLRLASLSLINRLVAHIRISPNIVRLTLHRPPGESRIVRNGFKMHNIQYLSIGFYGSRYAHRNQWRLLTYFPCLTHVFAYATDTSASGIHFPHSPATLRVIHRLETLHIHGSQNHVLTLASWLEAAADYERRPGSLRRFKLHSRYGIPRKDCFRLLDALSKHHPNLRILVLEGLASVPIDFAIAVRERLPALESLSLVRRATMRQTENKLCDWEAAVYEYAQAFQGFAALRHLEINTLFPQGSPGPSALDTLVAVMYGYKADSPEQSFAHAADDGNFDVDLFSDGASVAIPFASLCPTLQSFALRADLCYYSCDIERHENGTFQFVNARSHAPHNRFESWNPLPGSTW